MPASNSKNDINLGRDKQNEVWQIFSISRFHVLKHGLACFLSVMLCFSLLMSELSKYMQRHQLPQINLMSLVYLLLLAFIIFLAFTAILSVRKIRIKPECIEISNLLWQEKLKWPDLSYVQAPQNLKFAWIRTKWCVYIVIKNEFNNYSELEHLLGQYTQRQRLY